MGHKRHKMSNFESLGNIVKIIMIMSNFGMGSETYLS